MLVLASPTLRWTAVGPFRLAQKPEIMDVVSEHRPAVQALVARILRRSREDADVEDCTSETLRRAIEGHARLREGQPVRPWLLGIARHVALDAVRARQKSQSRSVSTRAEDGDEAPQAVDLLADPRSGPEALAVHRERADQLRAALATLPERQAQALLLFHVEGLGYKEIGQRLGVPIGTVGTWVLRARNGIAAAMAEQNPERGNP